MNTSILYDSFKYLNRNFEFVSSLSKYNYEYLTKEQYQESKLIKALHEKDEDIIAEIGRYIQNKNILNRFIIDYALDGIDENIDLIETILTISPELIHANNVALIRWYFDDKNKFDRNNADNIEILERLLKWKPNATIIDNYMYYLSAYNPKITELLIEYNPNLNVIYPISLCSEEFCKKFIQLLPSSIGNISYINEAIATHNTNIVKLFITEETIQEHGNSILEHVCDTQSLDMITYIINMGVIPSDNCIIRLGRLDILKTLLRNRETYPKKTLLVSIKYHTHVVFEYLFYEYEIPESYKQKALFKAVNYNNRVAAKILLENGIFTEQALERSYSYHKSDMIYLFLRYSELAKPLLLKRIEQDKEKNITINETIYNTMSLF